VRYDSVLDDIIVDLLGLKSDEKVLPPAQIVSIVARAIRGLQGYKSDIEKIGRLIE
jgi:hypothetical protein